MTIEISQEAETLGPISRTENVEQPFNQVMQTQIVAVGILGIESDGQEFGMGFLERFFGA